MSEEIEQNDSQEQNPSENQTTGNEEEQESSALTSGAEDRPPFDPDALELPDEIELTDEDRTYLTDLAERHDLSHDAVAEFVGTYVERLIEARDSVSDMVQNTFTEQNAEWVGQLNEMYGGEEKAQEVADRLAPFIDQYGGDELREALNVTGAGNHPAVFRFMEKVSAALGEGTPVNAGKSTGGNADPLGKLYPSMVQN